MTKRVRRLVVGLGNPGDEYAATRHNVGFDALDHLALREGLLFEEARSLEDYRGPRSLLAARAHDPDVLLVKPTTFMNRSGEVVRPLVEWAGVDAGDVLVVYDDLDLPVAALRIRPFGSAGGHNGMKSIIENLGTDRFPRLRIGVGRSPTDAARHVLSRFSSDERPRIDDALAEAADAVFFWMRTGDIAGCMTRFHSRWKEGSAP